MTEFERKVRSMSIKDIILAMVEGLRNPVTEIDMSTFGYFNLHTSVCYGCAATNTICKIGNIGLSDLLSDDYTALYVSSGAIKSINRAKIANKNPEIELSDFVDFFESMINLLRLGDIRECNRYLERLDLPLIERPTDLILPKLNDDYTREQLNQYIKLANFQE